MAGRGIRGRGRSLTKPALAFLLLFAAGFAFATDGPRVMLETSAEPPAVGSAWTVTVLVDYADPNMVSVLEPEFADGLVLERILRNARLLNMGSWLAGMPHAANHERWTAVEYRFILERPGRFSFGSFTVTTPHGRAETGPFTLEVRAPQTAGAPVRSTVWERTPESLVTGEQAVFSLRVADGPPPESGNLDGFFAGYPLPGAGLFMPAVPPGHILESLPLNAGDAARGTVLRLRLIPLEPGRFELERRTFSHGGAVFEIPALRIPVGRSAAAPAPQPPTAQPPAPETAPRFPSHAAAENANPRLFQRYRADFDSVYQNALNLWEDGLRANALAVLRRNERDHRAGELFAAIRREAEAALGLTGTPDERDARRAFFGGAPHRAVLLETAVRRIPDDAGAETARFREGQPVTVNRESVTGSRGETRRWVLVTANNGTSGWIPGENIISY